MTKAIAQTYNVAHEYRRQITYTLLACLAVLNIFYAINVYMVISRTVAVQKIDAEINALAKNVESLDSEYLALDSKITPDSLASYGLREGKVSAYISRTVPLSRVALGGHEL